MAVVVQGGRVGVAARGSSLGCEVDGRRIGGRAGDPGPVFFTGAEGTLRLGKDDSPLEFNVVVSGGSTE